MRRLLGILVAALVALVAVPAVGVGAPVVSEPPASAYNYGGHHHAEGPTHTTTERGPPAAAYDYTALRLTVDVASDGTLRRPPSRSAWTYTTYDRTVQFARGDIARVTTLTAPGGRAGDLRAVPRWRCAAKTAPNPCKLNSFTADTLVLMADGSKKPIKSVRLGDRVMATDPATGETGPREVVDLIRHGGLHTMVAVRLADGTTIDATDRHPFWVESRGDWVDAIELKPGDVVVTADGDRLTVESLGISDQDLMAYNLTVEDLHTYFAGRDSVLVHNAGCTNMADLPERAVRNLTQDANYAFTRLRDNHGLTRVEFREQVHMIKRNEGLPADFDLTFGPTGDVWNPSTGELIGSLVHGY